jgi:hypothetical protein
LRILFGMLDRAEQAGRNSQISLHSLRVIPDFLMRRTRSI